MRKRVFVLVSALVLTAALVGSAVNAQLTLPYSGSANTSATAFTVVQDGTGHDGVFSIGNSNSSGSALTGVTVGLGIGIHGKTYKGAAGVKGESVKLNGVGILGQANSGATSIGVYGYSSAGRGVVGVTQSGEAGVKGGTNKTNGIAVMGQANVGASAIGVYGSSTGGIGVKGETASTAAGATAILGVATATSAGSLSSGVRGISKGTGGNGVGVYGTHDGSGYGVYGYAPSGFGVIGGSSSGTGVYGSSSTGYAGQFNGKVYVSKNIVKAYTTGTTNNAIPIAYGTVINDGTLNTGTPNVSSTWDAANSRYEISITGENYYYQDYTTIVTPNLSTPLIATTNSVGGKLLVYLTNLSNSRVQGTFSFIVYKASAE